MTLAQLKRDANSGKMSLEMTERFGSTEIIERLKGIRKVKKANSVAIICINLDGQESELRIDSAKLIDYDGKTSNGLQSRNKRAFGRGKSCTC